MLRPQLFGFQLSNPNMVGDAPGGCRIGRGAFQNRSYTYAPTCGSAHRLPNRCHMKKERQRLREQMIILCGCDSTRFIRTSSPGLCLTIAQTKKLADTAMSIRRCERLLSRATARRNRKASFRPISGAPGSHENAQVVTALVDFPFRAHSPIDIPEHV